MQTQTVHTGEKMAVSADTGYTNNRTNIHLMCVIVQSIGKVMVVIHLDVDWGEMTGKHMLEVWICTQCRSPL